MNAKINKAEYFFGSVPVAAYVGAVLVCWAFGYLPVFEMTYLQIGICFAVLVVVSAGAGQLAFGIERVGRITERRRTLIARVLRGSVIAIMIHACIIVPLVRYDELPGGGVSPMSTLLQALEGWGGYPLFLQVCAGISGYIAFVSLTLQKKQITKILLVAATSIFMIFCFSPIIIALSHGRLHRVAY